MIGEYEITLKSNKKQNALLISDPWCVKYPMNGIGSSDEEPHALEERQLMEGLRAGLIHHKGVSSDLLQNLGTTGGARSMLSLDVFLKI